MPTMTHTPEQKKAWHRAKRRRLPVPGQYGLRGHPGRAGRASMIAAGAYAILSSKHRTSGGGGKAIIVRRGK